MSGQCNQRRWVPTLNRGRLARPEFPVIRGVRHGWLHRAARASVLRNAYLCAPWMHSFFERGAVPQPYEKHLQVSAREWMPATVTWAVHQQWREFARRSPAAPEKKMDMTCCTPAGVVIAVPKYITCRKHRLCPWCHQREVVRFFEQLPPLRQDDVYAATVFGFRPDAMLFPEDLELYRTAETTSSLRRLLRGAPVHSFRTFKYFPEGDQSEAWGIRTLVVTRLRGEATSPRMLFRRGVEHGLRWRIAGSVRELAGQVLPFMDYPVKLLDGNMPQREIDQLYRLSAAVRNTQSRPLRTLQLLTPEQLLSPEILEILNEQTAICTDERRPHQTADVVINPCCAG